MPKVIDNQPLSDMIWKMKVEVPHLVTKAKAGQFVIIRVNERLLLQILSMSKRIL